MKTHAPAPAEQTQQHKQQSTQTSAQLFAQPQATFEDARPEAAQLRRLQSMMAASPQQQKMQALQAKMAAGSLVQRMEDEELLQGKFATVQRIEDEELLQGKFETVQRMEDEELLQGKFETAQLMAEEEPLQGKFSEAATAQLAEKPNNTGLPNQLKAGIESLSGMSMDHVKVHYNSDKPAQLNAHAYAQGSDIHVAAGQEQHLPHEAWHVVQQAQGRVKPTVQMKGGVPVNDDIGLEGEADVMGAKALQLFVKEAVLDSLIDSSISASARPVQRNKIGDDIVPSYVSNDKAANADDQSLTHRGLVETEMVGDKKYVRAYQTVYANVDKGSGWKDTHQVEAKNVEDQKIQFLGKGDTWINFGNPLRALHYVRTYYAQAPKKKQEDLDKLPKDNLEARSKVEAYHGKPIIRSFLVPFEIYLEISGAAISEGQRAKLGEYNLNVDKSKAPDQYQVMEADVKKLKDNSVAGSMVSYVLDDLVEQYRKASHHGKVEGIKKLSEKLGLTHIFDPLILPMEGSDVPSSEKQAAHAEELGELYDLSLFMEKMEDHPKYAKAKLSKLEYLDLYLKHESRLSKLSLKILKSESLPETKAERDLLRTKLAIAANTALIPKLVEENYYEGTEAMHGKKKDGAPISGYAKKLTFEKLLLEPIVKEKIVKLTEEDKVQLKKEAEERKKQPKTVMLDSDNDLYQSDWMSNLFGS